MLSIIVHFVVILYYVLLPLMTFSFIWVFSCRILKRLKKFQYNVCHTKVRTCIQAYICNSVLYRFVYVCCVCVCVCVHIYMHVIFCSFSGLNHSLVQRLKPTWEKVPGKYRKIKKVRN